MDKILTEEFGYRKGFGVCGSSLECITKKVAEIYGSKHIRINVPYNGFNCKGTANQVAKEVHGLMPFSDKRIDVKDTKTLFYGDTQVNKPSTHLPFQCECNVYFVEKVYKEGKVIVIDLMEAPSWRAYL